MSTRSDSPSASWRRSTRDHAPQVLRRLLALLHSPLFVDVDVTELAILAEHAADSTFAPGDRVAPGGQRLPAIHHVLEGRIEVTGDPPAVWTEHSTLGLLEVLAERALPAPAIAATEVHTLEMNAAFLFEILEESFPLLALLLRSLAERALDLPSRWRYTPLSAVAPDATLGLVERMILIREHLPLLGARMQPLTILAHAAREVVWEPGEIVVHAGATDRDVAIIVDGTVAATRVDRDNRVLQPGAAFGALESLARRPFDHALVALSRVRAVALSPTLVVDVLEDHSELAFAIAASLASELLDGAPHGARATTAESNS